MIPIFVFYVNIKMIVYLQIIHLKGFTEAEMAHYICRIRGNLIDSMVTLVNAMDLLGIVFEKPVRTVTGSYNQSKTINNQLIVTVKSKSRR